MSKNDKVETYDENVVLVSDPRALPYAHIPFTSVAAARAKHPGSTLYVYEGKAPGWKIVAYPILMSKPEEVANEG
jgi:hypothetical protein